MPSRPQAFVMIGREIELSPSLSIAVSEAHDIENEAGNVIWDAGLVLINYLAHRNAGGASIVHGKRVVELGAGPGAVGLAAAALGASSVVLTDLPHLIPLLERNIALNRCPPTSVSAVPLDWCAPDLVALRPPFDLVLASDVLYQRHVLPAFASTLRALCGPATEVLLSNEHRPALPFPPDLFHRAGFAVDGVAWEDLHPEWRSEDIQVYRLTLA